MQQLGIICFTWKRHFIDTMQTTWNWVILYFGANTTSLFHLSNSRDCQIKKCPAKRRSLLGSDLFIYSAYNFPLCMLTTVCWKYECAMSFSIHLHLCQCCVWYYLCNEYLLYSANATFLPLVFPAFATWRLLTASPLTKMKVTIRFCLSL